MSPGMTNSQGAAASLAVLPLPAIREEQSAWVWGGEGCRGWGDVLNQAILPRAEGEVGAGFWPPQASPQAWYPKPGLSKDADALACGTDTKAQQGFKSA